MFASCDVSFFHIFEQVGRERDILRSTRSVHGGHFLPVRAKNSLDNSDTDLRIASSGAPNTSIDSN
ncbi:MAG: hypothetical protein LBD76_06465, partial [Prevotellaceae bacterium]|nr:hypothetical protein [Prevotellaceae bacterium]